MGQNEKESTPYRRHSDSTDQPPNEDKHSQYSGGSWKSRVYAKEKIPSDSGNCFFCGRKLNRYHRSEIPLDELRPTVDHVKPKSDGGILSKKNKVYACTDCNSIKGDMNVDQFIEAISGMQRLNHIEYQRQKAYLRKVKTACINLKKIEQ